MGTSGTTSYSTGVACTTIANYPPKNFSIERVENGFILTINYGKYVYATEASLFKGISKMLAGK